MQAILRTCARRLQSGTKSPDGGTLTTSWNTAAGHRRYLGNVAEPALDAGTNGAPSRFRHSSDKMQDEDNFSVTDGSR